jgi:hypothetical protein
MRGAGLPRRSRSIESYLWETRALAVAALLALVAGVGSDVVEHSFWAEHALLAGLASSVIIVALTVAVVNEAVERRRRRRWSVLAQYVMLQLVRDARLVWSKLAELAGLMPVDGDRAAAVEVGSRLVQDTPRLSAAVAAMLEDAPRRRLLHDEIARFVAHSDQVLGRWAGIMLNADVYAEVIDRHVELASDLAWLGSLLDNLYPPDDEIRRRKAGSHPALQVEGTINDEQLANRIVAIAQLAEQLDRGTLELALRTVPVEWWVARLGPDALGTGGSDSRAAAQRVPDELGA